MGNSTVGVSEGFKSPEQKTNMDNGGKVDTSGPNKALLNPTIATSSENDKNRRDEMMEWVKLTDKQINKLKEMLPKEAIQWLNDKHALNNALGSITTIRLFTPEKYKELNTMEPSEALKIIDARRRADERIKNRQAKPEESDGIIDKVKAFFDDEDKQEPYQDEYDGQYGEEPYTP